MNTFYRIARVLVRIAMFFAHPVFRVSGRENIPEGPAVICCNHSNLSDPIWVILGLWPEHMPACMAKKEVMQVPLLGALLRFLGAISVDRGKELDNSKVVFAGYTCQEGILTDPKAFSLVSDEA